MESVILRKQKRQNGYQLSDEIVTIEINDKGTFANGVLLEENNSECTFNFYNKLIPKVQTGTTMNYMLLVSSIIISLLGITGAIVYIKKRKQTNK